MTITEYNKVMNPKGLTIITYPLVTSTILYSLWAVAIIAQVNWAQSLMFFCSLLSSLWLGLVLLTYAYTTYRHRREYLTIRDIVWRLVYYINKNSGVVSTIRFGNYVSYQYEHDDIHFSVNNSRHHSTHHGVTFSVSEKTLLFRILEQKMAHGSTEDTELDNILNGTYTPPRPPSDE